jgi:hypothetical protein
MAAISCSDEVIGAAKPIADSINNKMKVDKKRIAENLPY